jgi:hypothetical protein
MAVSVEVGSILRGVDVWIARRSVGAMNVEAIKEVIAHLPSEERQSLAVWLNSMEYDAWDRQMAEDFSPEGRGSHLLAKVEADIAAGKFHPAAEGCEQRKRPA